MKPKRLGCLTIPGITASILTLLIIAVIILVRGGLLFNPGALNAQAGQQILGGVRSHADLTNRCSACHVAFWERQKMDDRCLSCHTDLVQDQKNFHAVMMTEGKLLGCRRCHTDHRGSNASLIIFDLRQFPHNAVGYSLRAHQKKSDGTAFACSDCHGKNYIQFDQTVCETCHSQIDVAYMQSHIAAFGTDCRSCHDGLDTYGRAFDHSRVAFQLLGKHATIGCDQCHRGARSLTDLLITPQTCYSCHAKDDAHNGQFGQDCGSCHTPVDWKQAAFDHTKTGFPLVGKHTQVDCKGCHVNNVFKGTPQDCYSCHTKDDVHNSQLGRKCEDCHTPVDWKLVSFDHSKAAFPLVGKHAQVACNDCHTNNLFEDTLPDCFACHAKADAHNGQFGQDCGSCHTPVDWMQVTFDHSKTGFPLVGKHTQVACQDCHANNVFKGTLQDCYACHAKDDAHSGQFGQDCGGCHTPVDWKQATFDHSKSAFPLTGAHARLKCTQCHVNNVFKGTPTECVVCHAEPGYHSGLFGTACASCHSTNAWSPAQFNGQHTFPMNHGGNNTCRTCHPEVLTAYTCYNCHNSAEIANKHREEGITNIQNCTSCHPTGRSGD